MAIRSGRFKGTINKAGDIKIIQGSNSSAVYRIFNSGANDFQVSIAGNPLNGPFTVKKKDSFDVQIKDAVSITTASTTAVEVEGIYEMLGSSAKMRNGRFSRENTNSSPITVVAGKKGSGDVMYRFLNSTENKSFNIYLANNHSQAGFDCGAIQAGNSMDVALAPVLKVKGQDDTLMDGIYDYLDGLTPVRSGRFKSKSAHATPMTIIQTAKGTPTAKWYRIYNSGDVTANGVIVVEGANVSSVEVKAGQTTDIYVSRGTMTVKSKDNAKPIAGIYEFLGTA